LLFLSAFKPGYYIKTNPDRSIAVNKITIPGLILNRLTTLYRDTRIVHKALYLDCKNARHASLIPASEALFPDAGILLAASIRSATLSNYTAGPLVQMDRAKIGLPPYLDKLLMTTKISYFLTVNADTQPVP